jgi:uncharacterized protein (DUF2235 family)
MKRIIVCCDGTWNRPDQVDRGTVSPSNVTKMALAVAPRDAGGAVQQVYYHRGVGTGRWDRIRGGVFGRGLSRNIRDAYRFLVENYDVGDELIFFGFSRGAYTVRSLAGFIRNCGLLRKEHRDRVEEAYRLYRRRDADSHPRAIEAQLFRKSYTYESYGHEVRIRCLGVWDTVGALGIPIGWIGKVTRFVLRLQFHDVKLSSYVDNAFQALAIDERRPPFKPAIWERQEHAKGQRLEQAWFAGVHTNVGGGYADSGLSDIAFLWMKERAASCGLAFDEDYVRQAIHPNVLGVLRDSRTVLYRLIPPYVRPVGSSGTPPTSEVVDPSPYERLRLDPTYRPENLPAPGGHL